MKEQGFIESRDQMERLLREEEIGYLGLCFNGKPYVVPLNYRYADGKIWFHCGFKGKKLDYLKRNPESCFVVARQAGRVREHAGGNPCHVDSDSVICYGKGRVVEDINEREIALHAFKHRFQPEAGDIAQERVEKCCVVEITISEMTGRQERERKRTCWHHSFSANGELKEANSRNRGFIYMGAYELFSYDEKNGYEFMGILPERRKDPKRITKESVLNWGRMVLGNNADGKKIFFKSIKIEDITGKTFDANLLFSD